VVVPAEGQLEPFLAGLCTVTGPHVASRFREHSLHIVTKAPRLGRFGRFDLDLRFNDATVDFRSDYRCPIANWRHDAGGAHLGNLRIAAGEFCGGSDIAGGLPVANLLNHKLLRRVWTGEDGFGGEDGEVGGGRGICRKY
jgi:hypothetical protein